MYLNRDSWFVFYMHYIHCVLFLLVLMPLFALAASEDGNEDLVAGYIEAGQVQGKEGKWVPIAIPSI